MTIAAVALLTAMLLTLLAAMRGPSLYDRLLAANTFGAVTVLFIAVHGFLDGRPQFLDTALVYALMNFIGTLVVLKFFEYGDIGRGSADEEPDL